MSVAYFWVANYTIMINSIDKVLGHFDFCYSALLNPLIITNLLQDDSLKRADFLY